jgi:hypothetical protein
MTDALRCTFRYHSRLRISAIDADRAVLDASPSLGYDLGMGSLVRFLIAAVAVCMPPSAAGQTYCALEVKVSSADGKPRSALPVAVVQNSQTTFSEAMTDGSGLARICDAPLESVDIAVGFDVCGLVMIRSLHPKWPDTMKLFVTYDDHPCAHFNLPQTCQVLLRVQDTAGRPLPGVRFVPMDQRAGSGTTVTDSLGRIYRVVKRDSRLEGRLESPSHAPKEVSVLVQDDKEMSVVLGQ